MRGLIIQTILTVGVFVAVSLALVALFRIAKALREIAQHRAIPSSDEAAPPTQSEAVDLS